MGQDVLSVGTMGHNYHLYICIYIYENQLYMYIYKDLNLYRQVVLSGSAFDSKNT